MRHTVGSGGRRSGGLAVQQAAVAAADHVEQGHQALCGVGAEARHVGRQVGQCRQCVGLQVHVLPARPTASSIEMHTFDIPT